MAKRRSLVDGVETIETSERIAEEEFVYGTSPRHDAPAAPPHSAAIAPAAAETSTMPIANRPTQTGSSSILTPLTGVGRVPVGARIRTELATALKRATLERRLQGIEPNTIQDILEELIEPWLQQNGYLL